MPRPQRDWYIAIVANSGEFAGNPATFEAATIFGPYTAGEAYEASTLSPWFPHETYEIEIFKCQTPRPRFPALKLRILELIRKEKENKEKENKEIADEADSPD